MIRFANKIFRRSVAGLIFLGIIIVLLVPAIWADPTSPSEYDRQVALNVTSLLPNKHLTRHPLDKEISERCFKTFLAALDPMKMFFYQSDIDFFTRWKDQLAEMTQRGDVSFAYTVYKTFLTRVDEHFRTINELLKEPQEFIMDEEIAVGKELVNYALTQAEARDRWRKRIKYDLLVLKADKVEGKDDLIEQKRPEQRLLKRYQSLAKQMHQTDNEELLRIYLTSLTTAFDPHTVYMSPSAMENFEIAMRLELEGIGAELQSVDGYAVVKRIIPGGAADRDGRLKVEDKIVGVGEGRKGEIHDVVDMKLNEAVRMIRGKPGTIVRLEIVSLKGERKIIEIVRAKIELTDSEAKGEIFEFGQKADGKPIKVGVIDLPSFYMDMTGAKKGLSEFKSTTRDVRLILDEFNRKDVDALVLDLRRNSGGSLTEAINLTGLFIQDGPVVQVKDADGRIYPYRDPDRGIAWSGPLIVLESKFSASASEILAGAIQDYGRGLIVGDHASHGKGTVQNLLELNQQWFRLVKSPQIGVLKITTQQFYRPGGASTQKLGVLADIELPSLTTHLDVGESDLDYPIPFDNVGPQKFKKLGYVTPRIVNQISRLSAARCAASEMFRKVIRNIARYKVLKDRKYVTLNEKKFLKERETWGSNGDEEKISRMTDKTTKSIEMDYYLKEVMAIMTDYYSVLKISRAK